MEKVLDYIRESKAELNKVTWPTKQQLWYSTIIVVIVTLIASAYLGLVRSATYWIILQDNLTRF